VTLLNHGSFGATPRPVFERYQAWQRELESEPVDFVAPSSAPTSGRTATTSRSSRTRPRA